MMQQLRDEFEGRKVNLKEKNRITIINLMKIVVTMQDGEKHGFRQQHHLFLHQGNFNVTF
jgi:hypothetical protein